MNKRKIIIAIDGHSACGKSTTARRVAQILGYRYIDTGAMYRAVTYYFLKEHISLFDSRAVLRGLKNIQITFHVNSKQKSETFLNGINVEGEIRKLTVSESVSAVSALQEVRLNLVERQRKLGKPKGVVMDGRDIGTVVFPQAELKIFMTADPMIRAMRRQKEWLEKDKLVNLDEVKENILKRDQMDTQREESPLRRAPEAKVIDTSFMTFDEQVDEVVRLAMEKIISPVAD